MSLRTGVVVSVQGPKGLSLLVRLDVDAEAILQAVAHGEISRADS